MKVSKPLVPFFTLFIKETRSGKRLKKNGERVKEGTIKNYEAVFKNFLSFGIDKNFDLRICNANKLTQREFQSEKNYWKKFYQAFTKYLYSKGCHDNYVGMNTKTIRTVFNFIERDKNFNTGGFQKSFYVRNESIAILVLSPDQLKFLIHDVTFQQKLSPTEIIIKKIFVFGCTTGLRFSDLKLLTSKNFEQSNDQWYLKIRSKKTKSFSMMKLPDYAGDIFLEFKKPRHKTPLFPLNSLSHFNDVLKRIGEKAGFTEPIDTRREVYGKLKKPLARDNQVRFCDKMSSHMMRRTAITTMLILGMPEHLVRVVSGHSMGASSFQRYIHYARAYTNKDLDLVYNKLNDYQAIV